MPRIRGKPAEVEVPGAPLFSPASRKAKPRGGKRETPDLRILAAITVPAVRRPTKQPERFHPPRRRKSRIMCKEQELDFKAARAGRISWKYYYAKWGGRGLSL
jgi:hypothetical protein